jgi:YD repeat-containing protein
VTTYNYDKNENLESTVDALTHTTTNLYDERNLLFKVTDANTPAGVTQYDYDINGNLAKIKDANTNLTTYTFDLFDRLTHTTYANTKFSQFDYDKNSNITRHTTPSTKPIDYVYDALNRMIDKIFTQTPSLNSTYAYDLGSRMTDANNSASTTHLDYDALNRLTASTQTVGGTARALTYDYYKNGLRKQLIYPSTKTLDYTYDDNNRLDVIKKGGVALVDYDYDILNRRTERSFLGATLPVAMYSYDLANR